MNYLAHSYLSFSHEQLVGNMIADFIKNREREFLPSEIQKGIKLHRAIDTFTDAHPVIHQAKKVFQPLVRLYSGAFVDVSFDYFLANSLGDESLKKHAQEVYTTLWQYEDFFPEKFKILLPKMQKDDWLYNYKNDWGIKFSFQNVLNKAQYLEKELNVFPLFLNHKEFLKECFDAFFPEIENFAQGLNLEFNKVEQK